MRKRSRQKKTRGLVFDTGSSRLSCFFSRPSPRLCHCPVPAPGRETASPVHSLLWPSPSIAPRGLFATSSLWNQPSPKVVPKFLARQPGAPILSPRQPSIPQKWWERGAGRCWLRYGGGGGGQHDVILWHGGAGGGGANQTLRKLCHLLLSRSIQGYRSAVN